MISESMGRSRSRKIRLVVFVFPLESELVRLALHDTFYISYRIHMDKDRFARPSPTSSRPVAPPLLYHSRIACAVARAASLLQSCGVLVPLSMNASLASLLECARGLPMIRLPHRPLSALPREP